MLVVLELEELPVVAEPPLVLPETVAEPELAVWLLLFVTVNVLVLAT